MSGDPDAEIPRIYAETVYRARKIHRCSACRESIEPGARYRRIFGVWCGSASTLRRCMRCDALWRHLSGLAAAAPYQAWFEEPDLTLDCGHSYEELHGPPPEHIAALAFALPQDFEEE